MTKESSSDNSEQVSEATDYVLTLKSELISLQNDIVALYQIYGEVNQQALNNLEAVALMHDVNRHALIRLIEQIELAFITENSNQKSFVFWVKSLHRQFEKNTQFCLSELEKNTVVGSAVLSTGKSAETLLNVLNTIQSHYSTLAQVNKHQNSSTADNTSSLNVPQESSSTQSKKRFLFTIKRIVFYGFIFFALVVIYFSLNEWVAVKEKPNSDSAVFEHEVSEPAGKVVAESTSLQTKTELSLFDKFKQGVKKGSEITANQLESSQHKLLETLDPINNEKLIINEDNNGINIQQAKTKRAINDQTIEQSLPREKLAKELNLQEKELPEKDLQEQVQLNHISQLLENLWVNIPAGSFVFPLQQTNKHKQHHYLTAFELMKTEVTFALWDSCVAAKACYHKPSDEGWGRGNRPVINVHWNEITTQFIPWLHRTTGHFYYLPSETQWEYAAQLASASPYHWGVELGSNNANCANCGSKFDNIKTAPVNDFFANQLGIFNMHGNVWEFTQDCWSSSLTKPQSNGSPLLTKACNSTVIKGGSFMAKGNSISISTRNSVSRQTRNKAIGFRLIRAL